MVGVALVWVTLLALCLPSRVLASPATPVRARTRTSPFTSATYVPTHTTLAHNCHALVPFSILNRLAVFVFHGFPCLTHLAQYRLLVCFASSFAYIVNINILIKPNQISTLALELRLRILVYLKSM